MLHSMTFEVKLHVMENLHLYNVIIHAKCSKDQILDKKDRSYKKWIFKHKHDLCGHT